MRKKVKAIIELDDFRDDLAEENLPVLLDLKEHFPNFKIAVGAITSKCSKRLLERYRKEYPFIEFFYHGCDHTFSEMERWSREECVKKFYSRYLYYGDLITKIVRAPRWQINDQCREAIDDLDWVLLDHPDRDRLLPPTKKYFYEYSIDSFEVTEDTKLLKLHGHLGHKHEDQCNNTIIHHWKNLIENLPPETEFMFLSEYLKEEL